MSEHCAVDPVISRKSQTQILQRLASVGQERAGTAIGVSETWVSRFASEKVKTFADLLSCIGLKVVPARHKCYDPEHIAHLEYFAKLGLSVQAAPIKLEFEEPEE